MDPTDPVGRHWAAPDTRTAHERARDLPGRCRRWLQDLPRRPGRWWRDLRERAVADPAGLRSKVWSRVAITLVLIAGISTVAGFDLTDEYRMARRLDRAGAVVAAQDVRIDISNWGGRGGAQTGDIHVLAGGEWFALQHTYSSVEDADGRVLLGRKTVGPAPGGRYPYGLCFLYDPDDHTVAMAAADVQQSLDGGPMPSGWSAVTILAVLWSAALGASVRMLVWRRRRDTSPTRSHDRMFTVK
ncbi:hypothetical protein PZ938_09145 [Luteipulveratus sp. YIM 133132]|uniref:hypothetical protein n=1 Tax=Luteipulveratus flavus TaxID=3031728 RepID=UPI0023AF7B53|nr:hypothetical protein [Luteipulveratus sp. YIM 133132]MDE9365765.1 hypothetical protein [Luteipulveratus sp. YIM 133132]